MSDPIDVITLVGSLRRESTSRRLALALASVAPRELSLEVADIGQLPLYNQDLEASAPQPWRAFRQRVRRARAVLFVTPEYNRSVPAALKNAIDVGSRPYGESVWSGKPAAIVSCSPGAIGGFGANHHLRQSLVFLNMPTLQQEAYIGGVDKLVTEHGDFAQPATREFCARLMAGFAEWIRRVSPSRPGSDGS